MEHIDQYFGVIGLSSQKFDKIQLAASLNDVQYLEQVSIDPNAYKNSLTPLHCAASNLAYDAVRFLHPFFSRHVDNEGRTALRLFLDTAIANELQDAQQVEKFVEILIDEADIIAADECPILHLAFALDSKCLIQFTFENQKDCVDANGTTSLMMAARYGHVAYFPQLEHELNSTDMRGRSAAFYAVQTDEVDMMLLLIDTLYGNRDAEGRTLLHEAARFNSLRCLELLKKTYFGNSDNYGNPALFEAVYFNHRWATEILSDEMYLVNKNGDTALHFAAKHDCFDVIELLEDLAGVRNYEDKLAIEVALEHDSYNAFEAMLVIEMRDDVVKRIVDYNAFKCLLVLYKLSKMSAPLADTARSLLNNSLDERNAIFRAISRLNNGVIRVLAKYITSAEVGAAALSFALDGGFFNSLDKQTQKALQKMGSKL